MKNCNPEDKETILKYKNSFLLGCILHDLGHAPFSHTCENLYTYQDKIKHKSCLLNSQLLELYSECAETNIYKAYE